MHTPYGLWKRTDGALQGNFYIFYQRLQISASHTITESGKGQVKKEENRLCELQLLIKNIRGEEHEEN